MPTLNYDLDYLVHSLNLLVDATLLRQTGEERAIYVELITNDQPKSGDKSPEHLDSTYVSYFDVGGTRKSFLIHLIREVLESNGMSVKDLE